MEDEEFIGSLQAEVNTLKTKNTQLNTALASSSYQTQEGSNLIEYQLETAEMLNKIEHFLRGDYMTTDEEGNECWVKQENNDLILFNDYGVNSIMATISGYIDKNTSLSTYDELRINEILADLGEEIAKFIFCNYEVMGMDTEFKKTRYALVVINILHSIESTYRKALRGQNREDLNTSKIFTQSDITGRSPMVSQTKQRFNLFKPKTW